MANASEMLATVESRLADSKTQGVAVENAITNLVGAKIERRTELVQNGLNDVKKLNKELAGIKAASPGFDAEGVALPGSVFTGCQIKRRKAILEKVEEVSAALEAQDFDKLSKFGY